jgi:hypothetical protein
MPASRRTRAHHISREYAAHCSLRPGAPESPHFGPEVIPPGSTLRI